MKFEKVRLSLEESLGRVKGIVPEAIGCQIMEIVGELEGTVFTLDQSEKQVGDEVIALLQKEKRFDSSSSDDHEELEIFHHAALKLGITSSIAALTERRALKRLLERTRAEDDKRKESIVAYLLHLMRKYSKLFRNEISNDTDSQGSAPCSPTIFGSEEVGGNGQSYVRQISKVPSINFTQNGVESGNMPIPPEELRCPISLQLMYDPVIITSGQTYERVCIEKWFSDGHSTCPKTRQQLSHLSLTPNYCIKGLIVSWCEQNGLPVPAGPPESLDLNYWRLALSEKETTYSILMENSALCQTKDAQVVPIEESDDMEKLKVALGADMDNSMCKDGELDKVEKYENLVGALTEGKTVEEQRKTVEQIRFLLKDDDEARIYMGNDGFVKALVHFLRSAINEGDEQAQENGAMALFNLAVNNNRNKKKLLASGLIDLLEEMIKNSNMHEAAAALYLILSCLDDAKFIIGSSQAVSFLVQLLQTSSCRRYCKQDALYTLYNLSTHPLNISPLLAAGVINSLYSFLTVPAGSTSNLLAEKALAILTNLASSPLGKEEIVSSTGLIGAVAGILDTGEPLEQEQAASCFFLLCDGDNNCCQMVLQEGVIPALVCMSINGTPRGREKAQKLLKLFREQRQRDMSPGQEQLNQVPQIAYDGSDVVGDDENALLHGKPLTRARSRTLGRALNSMWKIRNSLRHFC